MEHQENTDVPARSLPSEGAGDSNPKLESLSNDIDNICRKLQDFENDRFFVPRALSSPVATRKQHKAIESLLHKAGKRLAKMSKKKNISLSASEELKRLGERMAAIQIKVDAAKPRSVFRFCLGPCLLFTMWYRGFSWRERG